MRRPRFTVCPRKHGTTCRIGTLPANQAFGLTVTDKVRSKATPGVPITFAITVSGTSLSPAEASVTTSVGSAGSPAPTSTPVPTLPPTTLEPVAGSTITPPSLTGLFPTVTPQPTSSSASPGKAAAHHRRPARATEVSSAVPLDPRLIGGQLAGLAVLAAAITMVVARLSLRTPQSAAAGKDGDAPAAGSEPEPPAS
jgi:hypothetical protein